MITIPPSNIFLKKLWICSLQTKWIRVDFCGSSAHELQLVQISTWFGRRLASVISFLCAAHCWPESAAPNTIEVEVLMHSSKIIRCGKLEAWLDAALHPHWFPKSWNSSGAPFGPDKAYHICAIPLAQSSSRKPRWTRLWPAKGCASTWPAPALSLSRQKKAGRKPGSIPAAAAPAPSLPHVGCLAAAGPQARAGRRRATVCSGRRVGAGGEGQRAQSLSPLRWRILLLPMPQLLWRVAAVVWPPPRRSPVGGTAGVWSPLLRGICPLCWDVNPIPHHLSTFFRSEQPQVCLLSKHMDCKIKISICICPLKAVWRSRSSRPTHFVRV